jgi:hypothetical protein
MNQSGYSSKREHALTHKLFTHTHTNTMPEFLRGQKRGSQDYGEDDGPGGCGGALMANSGGCEGHAGCRLLDVPSIDGLSLTQLFRELYFVPCVEPDVPVP